MPKQRRTGLFSATLTSKKIEDLIKVGLRNPAVIKLSKKGENAHEIPNTLTNSYLICDGRIDKIFKMMKLIEKNNTSKIIVFFNTCASVRFYYKLLKEYMRERPEKFAKIPVLHIYGEMKQKKRLLTFNKFSTATAGLLFATDVIARGIDFPEVDYIFQIDPPQDPASFVHRIGRTARRGLEGAAVVFLDESEKDYIDFLHHKEMKIEPFETKKFKDFSKGIQKFESQIKKVVLRDKDFLISGSAAFVSFIRSYKEHQLASIFVFDELNLEKTAKSFFLFRLPYMKELAEKKVKITLATDA